jgi:hypothetical protein
VAAPQRTMSATVPPLSSFTAKQLQGYGTTFSIADVGVPSSWLELVHTDPAIVEQYHKEVAWSFRLSCPEDHQLYHELEAQKAECNLMYSPARSFVYIGNSVRSGWTTALDMRTVPDDEVPAKVAALKADKTPLTTMSIEEVEALCSSPEWKADAYRVRAHITLKLRKNSRDLTTMVLASTKGTHRLPPDSRWSIMVTAAPTLPANEAARFEMGSIGASAGDVEMMNRMVELCGAPEEQDFAQTVNGRSYALLHAAPEGFAAGLVAGLVAQEGTGGYTEKTGGASARYEPRLLLSAETTQARLMTSKYEREDVKRRKMFMPITLHVRMRQDEASEYYSEQAPDAQARLDKMLHNCWAMYSASLRSFMTNAVSMLAEKEGSASGKNAEMRAAKFIKLQERARKNPEKMMRKFLLVDPSSLGHGDDEDGGGATGVQQPLDLPGLPVFDTDADSTHLHTLPRFKGKDAECVIDVESDTRVYAYHADTDTYERVDPYADGCALPTNIKLLACAATYRLRQTVDVTGARAQLTGAWAKLKADVVIYDSDASGGAGGGGGGGGFGGEDGLGTGATGPPANFQF